MVGYQRYQKNQVEGSGPLGLVLLSYEVMYKSLAQARLAILANDFSAEADHVSRALEAIIELSTSLDMEQGADVAVNLAHLYAYMAKRLGEGLCSGATDSVDEVLGLATSLREGWLKLDEQQRGITAPIAAATPAKIAPKSSAYVNQATSHLIAYAG